MDAKEEECRRFWRLERVAFLIEVVGVGGEDMVMGGMPQHSSLLWVTMLYVHEDRECMMSKNNSSLD